MLLHHSYSTCFVSGRQGLRNRFTLSATVLNDTWQGSLYRRLSVVGGAGAAQYWVHRRCCVIS